MTETLSAAPLDQTAVEEFAGRMIGMLNDGMLALMTSVGHRTGLFDSMAGLGAATSEQIAVKAGLQERYVREWLGAMVTGGIVSHDGDAGSYQLPPEHAASLTRTAGVGNLASFAQFMGMLGEVETAVVDCFRNGGGVPYSAFPTFQALMASISAQTFEATLVDVTLPLVDGLVERLRSGIDVADVGCGAGHAINLMAKAFPASRFVGFDISDVGIAAGRAEAATLGLDNATFEVCDAAALERGPSFDLITSFDSVHDQARPDLMLAGIAAALRPGGVYLCVDVAASSVVAENVDHPLGPFLYTVSCMHCMTVSLAEGGFGLGAMWGEQKAREMLGAAGFTGIEVKQVPGDIENNYYIATKG
jgi:SAM-dependent methyltransferase